MWALVRREFEGEVASNLGERAIYYVMFGIVPVLFVWLLGPKGLGFFHIEGLNIFTLIMGVIITASVVRDKLKYDHVNCQMTFLQCLPFRKTNIVHAKFLSVFILWCFTFIWMGTVVAINLMISSTWTMESWALVLGCISILLLIKSITLLNYFMHEYRNTNFVYLFIIPVMIALSIFLKFSGLSNGILGCVLLVMSLVIYAICWSISVHKINKTGFSSEKVSNKKSFDEQLSS